MWQTTYPSLATVSEASVETLTTWIESLPAPQTDVQRTVLRRLALRRQELMALELRAKALIAILMLEHSYTADEIVEFIYEQAGRLFDEIESGVIAARH